MSVWSIWQRWFGKFKKGEHPEALHETAHEESRGVDSPEQEENRVMHAAEHGEGQLRAELRRLEHQRHATLARGCFSDRELDEKDLELEGLDRRISAVKSERFYLRTRGRAG